MRKLTNLFRQTTPTQKLMAVILFSVLALFLSSKVQFQKREIMPFGMHRLANFEVQEAVPINNESTFRFAVTGDLQLLEKPIFAEDLSNPSILNSLPENKLEKFNLKVRRLGFKLATYQQKLKCEKIKVRLNNGQTSEPLSCAKVRDNEIVYFNFSETIKPGIYDLKFVGTFKTPLAVYASTSETGLRWIPVHYQKEDTATFFLLRDWIFDHPFLAVFYLSGLFITSWLFIFGTTSTFTLAILLAALISSHLLIHPLFSGHDETAHISMLNNAFNPGSDSREFNTEAFHLMIENDFFKLHDARILEEGDCPHKILYTDSCGMTDPPTELYKIYHSMAETFNIPSPKSPQALLIFGRIANVIWILVLGGATYLILGQTGVYLLLFYTLLWGTFLGQVASISNDPPMYLLGFSIAIGIAHFYRHPRPRNVIYLILLCAYFYFVKEFDRSTIAAIPGLAVAIILSFTQFKHNDPNKFKASYWNSLFFTAVYLLFLTGGIHWKTIGELVSINFVELVSKFTPEGNLLGNISKYEIWSALHSIWLHLKSALGSFIWGHSEVPTSYAGLSLVAFIGLSLYGISLGKSGKFSNILIISIFAGLMATQSLIVLAAQMSNFRDPRIVFESYLKVRLTAPGIAAFLVPISIGLLKLWEHEENRPRLFKAFSLWAILWQAYLLPFVVLKEFY